MFGNGLTSDFLRKVPNVVLLEVDIVLGQNPLHADHVLALGIVRSLLARGESVELVSVKQIFNHGSPSFDPLVNNFQRAGCTSSRASVGQEVSKRFANPLVINVQFHDLSGS